MNYFTDYKRHGRYFDPSPYETAAEYKMNNDFRRSHHENPYHNTYNELPRCNYGPNHMHNSYENYLHGNHAAKRSRENFQHCESNAPYYYNNNINSPMMNSYYNGDSYRRDSSPASSSSSSSYHHWMNNGYPANTNSPSQYYPPVPNYGNSSPYYPTPPPSASPAGSFYPTSKTSERLPTSYEFDYYKDKSENHMNDQNQSACYPTTTPSSYNNEMNSNRTMYPKLDYASNTEQENERKHFQSTEQIKATKYQRKELENEDFDSKFKDEKLELNNHQQNQHADKFVDSSSFMKKSSDTATGSFSLSLTHSHKKKTQIQNFRVKHIEINLIVFLISL
jgi:hypothetical protein